ncbi:sugar isomerase [Blautia sp. HCP28S3_G10]|uniref:lipopolysaccharide biosynthesis protein n=1 Tax=Blautia sp. HCP28S3_G10 TaxID=3438908 RepID=UPI003F8AA552
MLNNSENLTKSQKLSLTTLTSLTFQVLTIVSGFILPILRLKYYGSEINGLVVSITQFLGLISFLDLGVGQVVQANLYEPLAKDNFELTSDILASGKKFFRTLAKILAIYSGALAILYPFIGTSNFDYWFVFLLVLILSIDSFAQYYFGITYQLLLNSDQRGYVQYTLQIITVLMNLILSVVLITSGFGIHTVKLLTSLIYLLRPIGMYWYVRNKYKKIDFKKKINYEPIKQKWNGFAQHIASVVLNNTDTVVLTLFATLNDVSVYAVYNLVVSGVKQLFTSMVQGIQPVLGEFWAKREYKELNNFFGYVEWVIHTATIFLFGCTATLIVPFVEVYTKDITDCNYVAVAFGILLTAAHAAHCIRLPYNLMVIAGGHFKQTQSCYIIAAGINIGVSVLAVYKFGLIGVAIGTLISMVYQTGWLAVYLSKNLIKWNLAIVIKQLIIDLISVIVAYSVSSLFELGTLTYASWVVLALKVAIVWLMVIVLVNFVLKKDYLIKTIGLARARTTRGGK